MNEISIDKVYNIIGRTVVEKELMTEKLINENEQLRQKLSEMQQEQEEKGHEVNGSV
ncbi:MAG: hypothetical protein ACQESM_07325 [Bacteroidota bacterium]